MKLVDLWSYDRCPSGACRRRQNISKVWESCLRKEAVSSPDRITSVDYWVSYAAQYYDLNFKETWRIMKEKDYISRIIKRLEYKEKDTREKMEILEQQMNAYMEKILC